MKHKQKPYLTPIEVAELLMVSPVTVRQWAQKGLLNAATTPGGHRRFLRREVERFARQRGLALQPPEGDTMRILIVDDDKLVAESLEALFQEFSDSVTVEVAYDGFDAGQKILGFQPHVVLLDLVMPGLDGFQVCARLKADPTTKASRIIAMTTFPSRDNVRRILEAGAEICLSKPLNVETLLDTIGLETEPSAGKRA